MYIEDVCDSSIQIGDKFFDIFTIKVNLLQLVEQVICKCFMVDIAVVAVY